MAPHNGILFAENTTLWSFMQTKSLEITSDQLGKFCLFLWTFYMTILTRQYGYIKRKMLVTSKSKTFR